jgi:hypothetical protein
MKWFNLEWLDIVELKNKMISISLCILGLWKFSSS